jgi:hypothetical protein
MLGWATRHRIRPSSFVGRAGAVEGFAFLSVILSERSESKDPYCCRITVWPLVTATNLGLPAAKGSLDSSLRSSLGMTPRKLRGS